MEARAAFTVAQIAAHVGGVVEGDGGVLLRAVVGLEEAGPDEVSFVANRRYVRLLKESRAGAVLVGERDPSHGKTVIRCKDPYLAFAQVLGLFHPVVRPLPGVHPMAVVEGVVDPGATVMAFAYVGPGARVGAGTVLHPHSYVGPGAVVGVDCVVMAGAVVGHDCALGDRVWLNPGAVVGGEGFGFVPTARGHVKIPQTGRAVVEDDVEIGSNSNVDRAAMGATVVRAGARLDNLVQVGHGAEIGSHSLLVAYAGVAGSTRLGKGVVLAARAGALGHLEIGDGVQVGAYGLLTEDTPAGAKRSGIPAMEHARWLRVAALTPEIPSLFTTVRKLEARIAELERSALRGAAADGGASGASPGLVPGPSAPPSSGSDP